MFFPHYYTECGNCGKPFEFLKQDPDIVRDQITDILEQMFVESHYIIMLCHKSISLIKSNDCMLSEISKNLDAILFTFKKEHRYFYTEYECVFIKDFFRTDRVFYDYTIRSNYEKLLRNDSFKKLIKEKENQTGFTFDSCAGGYENPDFDIVTEDFTFNSKYKIYIRFKTQDNKLAVYDIDLDSMKLSDECTIYSF